MKSTQPKCQSKLCLHCFSSPVKSPFSRGNAGISICNHVIISSVVYFSLMMLQPGAQRRINSWIMDGQSRKTASMTVLEKTHNRFMSLQDEFYFSYNVSTDFNINLFNWEDDALCIEQLNKNESCSFSHAVWIPSSQNPLWSLGCSRPYRSKRDCKWCPERRKCF